MVLIANHQSEADPAVFALLLEKTFPKLAQGEKERKERTGAGVE